MITKVSSDFEDLFVALNRHKVRYLLIGAYATIHYTVPRYTKDIDIFVDVSAVNAKRLYKALKEFGAPLKAVSVGDFRNKDTIFQIGVAPVRIDILCGLESIEFGAAWKNRIEAPYGSAKANVIGVGDLIKTKESAKRSIDLFDLAKLKKRVHKQI